MDHELSPVAYGPLQEEALMTAGLDYYKPTMSQLAYNVHPEAEVTFTFKNRGTQRLLDHVDPAALQTRFDEIVERGFDEAELDYLATLTHASGENVFTPDYLEHLRGATLPKVDIAIDNDDLAFAATGRWDLVTFWETVVMSEVNQAYFEGMARNENLDVLALYDEGQRRLDAKIAVLQANPDIKFADFGTRRHFSLRWQDHVVNELLTRCPENIIGTSNVALARKYGVKPIGTFAHEMPMTYAGIADAQNQDIRGSHNQMLEDWYQTYGADLSVALTDTFGSDFFFADFTPEQAEQWRGLRHDSGDPVEFAEKAIAFYQAHDIDPTTKTIVFSDGLDIDEIVRLHDLFKDRVNVLFGWGTTLTNDLGPKALNIVMKATHVHLPDGTQAAQVKLSDNSGKHTGPTEKIKEYEELFDGTLTPAA